MQGLQPPPRDFTTAEARSLMTRERMIDAVTNGRPGTAMTAWNTQLSDTQIAEVVDYIRANFMEAEATPSATVAEHSTLAGRGIVGESGKVAESGKSIYALTCSVCHGEDGSGAVWGKTSLNPAPINFREADPQRVLTRERMIASVTFGRPGTAMTAYSTQLSEQQIANVVDYIRVAFMTERPASPSAATPDETVHAATTVGTAVLHGMPRDTYTPGTETGGSPDLPLPNNLAGNIDTGLAFYLQNCTDCHGTDGDGTGPRAYFIFPKPRNFLLPANQARLNRPTLFKAIKEGVPGREMPAWGKVLSDQQIADIAEYVFQTFINPDSPDNTGLRQN
jgi:mono/diheme cytochrome c family protein